MEYRRYNKRKCNVINRTAPIHPFIMNQIVIVIYYFNPYHTNINYNINCNCDIT